MQIAESINTLKHTQTSRPECSKLENTVAISLGESGSWQSQTGVREGDQCNRKMTLSLDGFSLSTGDNS
jgi:hypothetical protein